jgi:hypothetical protein
LLLLLPLIMPILTGVRWNLSVVLICISLITREENSSSCIFWLFMPIPLRIPCLIHVPISSLKCWFFGSWVFWIPYRFWISVPCQMSSWQRFSPILWAVSWVWWQFSLLCRISLVWSVHHE